MTVLELIKGMKSFYRWRQENRNGKVVFAIEKHSQRCSPQFFLCEDGHEPRWGTAEEAAVALEKFVKARR